jgi:hypothetical protein
MIEVLPIKPALGLMNASDVPANLLWGPIVLPVRQQGLQMETRVGR